MCSIEDYAFGSHCVMSGERKEVEMSLQSQLFLRDLFLGKCPADMSGHYLSVWPYILILVPGFPCYTFSSSYN